MPSQHDRERGSPLAQKLLIFSDIHLLGDGGRIIGLDPAARFREGLSHALAHHADADHLVLLGDLTHHGRSVQYRELQELLSPASMPVTHLLGNHDNRANFIRHFPQAPVTSAGHVQAMLDLGDSCLITLDTTDPDVEPKHAGRLCRARLDWLDQALTWAGGKPVALAMHHPPLVTGLTGMDRIALQNPDALYDRLAAYTAPVHLLCGHIHRTISGTARGVGFTIFKSPCHQHPMSLGVEGSSQSVDEPGAYGIVLASAAGFVVYSEDFAIAAGAATRHDLGSK